MHSSQCHIFINGFGELRDQRNTQNTKPFDPGKQKI